MSPLPKILRAGPVQRLVMGRFGGLNLIQGAASHALPLKTFGGAMVLRNALLRSVTRIEPENAPRCPNGHRRSVSPH